MTRAVVRYGIVDDEPYEDGLDEIAKQLEENERVRCSYLPPRPFGELINEINAARLDGLIIDLRLDLKSPRADDVKLDRVDYRGSSLAQEIRTRSTEQGVLSIPLVLWSAQSKLRRSLADDSTSYDLFDRVYDKLLMLDDAETAAAELYALARGYKKIASLQPRGRQGVLDLLGVDEVLLPYLDPAIGEQFQDRVQYPAHQYAQFILTELLEVPGVLLDESHLAARLGIARESSDWEALLEAMAGCSYSGLFSEAWTRWWMPLVNRWWRRHAKSLLPLRRATAAQRLAVIKRATGLRRLSCIGGNGDSSSAYWFVDAATGEPLPADDAVRVRRPRSPYSKILRSYDYPWQDGFFVSRSTVESHEYKEFGLTIDPTYVGSATKR